MCRRPMSGSWSRSRYRGADDTPPPQFIAEGCNRRRLAASFSVCQDLRAVRRFNPRLPAPRNPVVELIHISSTIEDKVRPATPPAAPMRRASCRHGASRDDCQCQPGSRSARRPHPALRTVGYVIAARRRRMGQNDFRRWLTAPRPLARTKSAPYQRSPPATRLGVSPRRRPGCSTVALRHFARAPKSRRPSDPGLRALCKVTGH